MFNETDNKKEYFIKKSNEFTQRNIKIISGYKLDKIGNVYVTDSTLHANQLNKVLSDKEFLKNEYMSHYYMKRCSGISHDKAIKDLKNEYVRKVAISNRDWTNLKLAER